MGFVPQQEPEYPYLLLCIVRKLIGGRDLFHLLPKRSCAKWQGKPVTAMLAEWLREGEKLYGALEQRRRVSLEAPATH